MPLAEERQDKILVDDARFKIMAMGRRWGKDVALSTIIPTPDIGRPWTTMGELKEGDYVFDDNGFPTRVTFKSEVFTGKECYKVTFSDGTEVVASETHEWLTEDKRYRKSIGRLPPGGISSFKPEVRTTKEVYNTLLTTTRKLETNHSVANCGYLEYNTRNNEELPIDPYTLGYWLGDGFSGSNYIATGALDAEKVVEYIEYKGEETYRLTESRDTVNRFGIKNMKSRLQDLNLLNNKHVPDTYLYAAPEERLELLKGLMDSDGTCDNHSSTCSFEASNEAGEALVDAIYHLAVSMGWKATKSEKEAFLFYEDGSRKYCGIRHEVRFVPTEPVFKLERKACRQKFDCLRTSQRTRRYIINVEPVESVPTACIEVDSPSHLYLCTRACIPTHNTTTGLIAAVIGHGPPQLDGTPLYPGAIYGKKIWWVAPTFTTLSDIWRHLKFALKDATIGKNENEHRIDIPGGGSITVRSTEAFDNLRGPGVDGMLLDEAAYIDRRAWATVLRAMLADRNGWAMFMSTPKGKNWFFNMYEAAATRPKWRRWHAPSTENPRMTQEEIEEIRSDPEMTEMEFRQEYLAEFVAPGANKFREEWVRSYTYEPITDDYVLHDDPNDPTKLRVIPADDVFVYGTVDLAISTKEHADWSVFQIWGATPEHDLLLLDQTRDRMENPEQLATLRALNTIHRPAYFGIEATAYQLALIQQARREGIPTQELKADKDKVTRAAGATTRMAAGKVFFDETADYLPSLKEELFQFPHAKHDDQVDAFAYAAILLTSKPRNMLFEPTIIKDFNLFSLQDFAQYVNPQTTFLNALWQTENGYIAIPHSVDHLMSTVNPRFRGDGIAPWHIHVALSKNKDYAAITLAQITRWDDMINAVERTPYAVQSPFFEVPFFMKIGAEEGQKISVNTLVDFVIAFKHARRFNITSTSLSGVKSATATQKLSRAMIAVRGLTVDPLTGLALGQSVQVAEGDFQPWADLKLMVETDRVKIVDNQFIKNELLQIDDQGKTLVHDTSAATAVAQAIGNLARFGHQEVVLPDDGMLSLLEAGFEQYTGLRVGYYDD